eukprot:COSAG01_NODE_306_length_19162_cov_14.196611_20_plen_1802_part_00
MRTFENPVSEKADSKPAELPIEVFDSADEDGELMLSPRSPMVVRPPVLSGKALGCIDTSNPARVALFGAVNSAAFNWCVLLCTAATVAARIAQMPAYEKDLSSGVVDAIKVMDWGILGLYTVEFLLKAVAMGLLGADGYFGTKFNLLDFAVLIWSWATVTSDKPLVRMARVVRVFIPLQHNDLVIGLNSIVDFFPYVLDVTGFMLFFFCIFGTIGVQLFGGVLTHRCQTAADIASNVTPVQCPHSLECASGVKCAIAQPNEDVYPDDRVVEIELYGFDNILVAFLTQFVITTLDEWPAISVPLIKSDSLNTELVWIYCSIVIMLLAVLTANLFVSVIAFAFCNSRHEMEGDPARIAKIRKLFNRIDDDQSGTIEAAEIGRLAALIDVELEPGDISKAAVELDQDGSGQADFEEFVIWWDSSSTVSAKLRRGIINEEALIQASFDRIDEDGSRTLDAKEVKSLAYHMGITLSEDESRQALVEMDLAFEKPGQTPEVSFDDFTAWWLSGSPIANKIAKAAKGEDRKIRQMFDRMDTDGSGQLDEGDFVDKGAASFGVQVDAKQAKNILTEMLRYSDGTTSTISFETFVEWWKSDDEIVRTIREGQQQDEAEASKIYARIASMTDDKDFRLDASDMMQICTVLGLPANAAAIDSLIKDMDAGQDGQVEFSEFYLWLNSGSDFASQLRVLTNALMEKEAKPWPYIPGCSDACSGLCSSSNFELSIIVVVVLNTIVMAMDHRNDGEEMPEDTHDFIRTSEIAFTIIYIAEAVVKMFGLGFLPYLNDGLNIMDLAIVIASIVGIFAPVLSSFAAFRVVRLIVKMLRVLRMVKVLAKYQAVVMLLRTTVGSSKMMSHLVVLLVAGLCLQSVVAGHVLGTCHIPKPDSPHNQEYGAEDFPRTNFYTFHESLLTNFQILTGEDWAPIMYRYMKCSGNWAAAYFVLSVLATNFVFLDIFIAVVLENFELSEDEKKIKQQSNFLTDPAHASRVATLAAKAGVKERQVGKLIEQGTALSSATDETGETSADQVEFDEENPPSVKNNGMEVALCCLDQDSSLRQSAQAMITNPVFDYCILGAIVVSSLVLAVEGPPNAAYLKGEDGLILAMEIVNYIVYGIFVLEMVIRMAADGFYGHSTAYIHDSWNQIDFFIVVISTIDIIVTLTGSADHTLRAFRVMRVVRTVKMVRLNEEMRVVFVSLADCIPTVAAVVALSFLFYMSFGILGVGLFAGKFYRCDCGGEWGVPERNCTHSDWVLRGEHPALDRQECEGQGGAWANPPANFDNIFEALRALFISSTTEGWVDIMYSGLDANELGKQPVQDINFASSVFFVAFILIGSLFITNLFIGVLVNFFGEANGSLLLTTRQKEWIHTQLLCKSVSSVVILPPSSGVRGALYPIVESAAFSYTISLLIVGNVGMLMCETAPMDQDLLDVFNLINLVLLIIFTLEMALKIVAYGPMCYVGNGWNRLDAFTVVTSWIGIVAENAGGIQALRAIRVTRLLLLLKNAPQLQSLLKTLLISLLPAFNITILLLLVLFVYAVVGMHLFGEMPRGQFVTDQDNFDDVIHALRLLFQIATGQDFMNIMHEMELAGQKHVFVFFGSYIVASIWVFFNLFVAVLLENFERNFTAAKMELSMWHIDEFKRVWCEFAPAPGHESVPFKDLLQIVPQLSEPLGNIAKEPRWHKRLLFEMTGSTSSIECNFHDTLLALCLVMHTYDGLTFAEQQEKRRQLSESTERHAARVLALYARVWLLARRPPPDKLVAKFRRASDDSDLIVQARYIHSLCGIRLMLLDSMVRCNKVVQASEARKLASG